MDVALTGRILGVKSSLPVENVKAIYLLDPPGSDARCAMLEFFTIEYVARFGEQADELGYVELISDPAACVPATLAVQLGVRLVDRPQSLLRGLRGLQVVDSVVVPPSGGEDAQAMEGPPDVLGDRMDVEPPDNTPRSVKKNSGPTRTSARGRVANRQNMEA